MGGIVVVLFPPGVSVGSIVVVPFPLDASSSTWKSEIIRLNVYALGSLLREKDVTLNVKEVHFLQEKKILLGGNLTDIKDLVQVHKIIFFREIISRFKLTLSFFSSLPY